MKPMLALDLDDVIYPFMPGIVPRFNSAFGASLKINDFFSFDFEKVIGVARSDVIDVVHSFFTDFEREHPKPMEGSINAIEMLHKQYRLSIVTAREDSLHKVTMEWLNLHFPGYFDEVHLCSNYSLKKSIVKRPKVDVCVELGAVALVDDNLHNLADIVDKGIKAVLFGNFPWNQSSILPVGVVRALNWEEVIKELTN